MESIETLRTEAKQLLLSDLSGEEEEGLQRLQGIIYDFCVEQYPNTLSLKLACLLHFSLQRDIISRYASLLYDLLQLRATAISPVILTELKPRLLECFLRETSRPIQETLSKLIGIVANRVFETMDAEWPELLDFIISFAETEDDEYKVMGFLVFSNMPMNMDLFLRPRFDSFYSANLKYLRSPNKHIRFLTFRTLLQLITHAKGSINSDGAKDLLPEMLEQVVQYVHDREEMSVIVCLQNFLSVVRLNPKFFAKHFKNVCESMIQIAQSENVVEHTRSVALYFLSLVYDSSTKEVLNLMQITGGEIVHSLLSIAMSLLVFVEDDPAWYDTEGSKGITAGKKEGYQVGVSLLDMISCTGDKKVVLPFALLLMQQYVLALEWQKRHAGIIALPIVANLCLEETMNNLEKAARIISISLQDPHPRVRLAAANAVQILSGKLAPKLQVQYHHMILPALNALTEDYLSQLQAEAARAIRCFIRGCVGDELTFHLKEIVNKMLVLLQNEKKQLHEEAMATLTSIAILSQGQFHRWYVATLCSLKAILFNDTDESKLEIRARSAECISSIALGIGKEKFINDAAKVMEVLIALQQSLSDKDRSARIHLLKAWTKLCQCLGKDSLVYVRDMMPIFLRSAELSTDQNIDWHSNVLQEKALACKLLSCCACHLKEDFFTWVSQAAKILVPLLQFQLDSETRRTSVSAMPELLHSAMLAIQKRESGGYSMSSVEELLSLVVPGLVKALKEEQDKEICATMLSSLRRCIEESGSVFTAAQIKLVTDGMMHVLYLKPFNNLEDSDMEDFDVEDEKSTEKQLEDIIHHAGNCLSTMIQVFKDKLKPYFDKILSKVIARMCHECSSFGNDALTFSIVNCVIHRCPEAAHGFVGEYLPLLLKACDDEDSVISQRAAIGFSVCAEFAPSKFKTTAEAAVASLNSVIRRSDALSPENRKTRVIAVSALGKICELHRESINAPQVVPTWLSYLPIKDDSTEAKQVHEQLCSMLERSDKELLGPDNLHLPKIIEVLKEVVAERDNLATTETADRMVALLKQFEKP